jgi:hypothetical protein
LLDHDVVTRPERSFLIEDCIEGRVFVIIGGVGKMHLSREYEGNFRTVSCFPCVPFLGTGTYVRSLCAIPQVVRLNGAVWFGAKLQVTGFLSVYKEGSVQRDCASARAIADVAAAIIIDDNNRTALSHELA